MPDECDIN